MAVDTRTVAQLDSNAQYRVRARCPVYGSLEEFFDNRSEAMQLMEELAEQGFAVMVSRIRRA